MIYNSQSRRWDCGSAAYEQLWCACHWQELSCWIQSLCFCFPLVSVITVPSSSLFSPYKGSFEPPCSYFSLSWAWKSLWLCRVFISLSSHQRWDANSIWRESLLNSHISFCCLLLFIFYFLKQNYLFPLCVYSIWTEGMVNLSYLVILFGYTYQITTWKKFSVEVFLRSDGWVAKEEARSFGRDGSVVCCLGLGTAVFQLCFTVFPYLITDAV